MSYWLNQCVLITGGTGALGSALVAHFHGLGAKVAFQYGSNDQKAQEILSTLGPSPRLFSFKADITSEGEVDSMAKSIESHMGPISIVVHCAGIREDQLLMMASFDSWKRSLAVTLDGAFLVSRAAVSSMITQRFGRIIYIGSIIAQIGMEGQTAYSTARAGLVGLTKSLSREVARKGITVNLLSVGPLTSGMTADVAPERIEQFKKMSAVRRLGTAEEVAQFVESVAGPGSSYLTGQVIHLDGGIV